MDCTNLDYESEPIMENRVADEPAFIVERILDRQVVDGMIEYRCRYADFGPEHDGWVSILNCDAQILIDEYYQRIQHSKEKKIIALQENKIIALQIKLERSIARVRELEMTAPTRCVTRSVAAFRAAQQQADELAEAEEAEEPLAQQQQQAEEAAQIQQQQRLRPSQRQCVCPLCNMVCSRAHVLRIHMKRKHSKPNSQMFYCGHCSAVYTTKPSLSMHMAYSKTCCKHLS